MSISSEQVSDQSTRHRGATECKPLIAAATKDLFRKNAFRIAGLAVDSTGREVADHSKRLNLLKELGQNVSAHNSAMALVPPPSHEEIREALEKLKNPEMRFIDEFFWFWPQEFGDSKSDPAFQALAQGKLNAAVEIWNQKTKGSPLDVVAAHNLAVVIHVHALDLDNFSFEHDLTATQKDLLATYWKGAVNAWERLATSEPFWEVVRTRVRQLNEPALTSGFVKRMQASFPEALAKINAELAVLFANLGKPENVAFHCDLLHQTNRGLVDVEKVVELALAPTVTRLKEQIKTARESAQTNPEKANESARKLVSQVQPLQKLFNQLFGEQEHFQKEVFDEAATAVINCIVAYQRKSGDNETFVKVLEQTLPLAGSVEVKNRIKENIQIGKGNLAGNKVDAVFALLKSIKESKDKPATRLTRFQSEVIPVIAEAAGISGYSESHGYLSGDKTGYTELFDSAAIVLRDISLAAWNDFDDKRTAVQANKLAIQHAIGAELKQRLLEDRATLQKNTTHNLDGPGWQRRHTGEKSSNVHPGMVALGIVGILVVWGIIGSCNSTNNSPHSTTYESHPASTPAYAPPPATSAGDANSDGKVYRVPSYVSSSLDREKLEIEADRAVLKQQADQLDALGREIDSDRIYLDKTSEYSVNAFNAKVDRYNYLSQQAKAANAAFNARVDSYNAKLQQYGH